MRYLILSLSICFVACQQPKQSSPSNTPKKAAIVSPNQARLDSIHKEQDKQYLQDSLVEKALIERALAYAKKHAMQTYNNRIVTSLDSFPVKLTYGHLFDGSRTHLLIYNKTYSNIFIHLFEFKDSDFKQLFSLRDEELTFTGYQFKDVNGDGIKDFLYTYYPSSGCCRRDVNMVYLYQPSGKLSAYYKFVNPTFYPKEKLIRGVEYGHPGEVPLYKFKWRGFEVDTLEYIYRADTTGNMFYRVRHRFDNENPSTRKLLNALPPEYRKIESIEWFLMNE